MIKRLNDLRLNNNKLYRKIIMRQRRGTMSVHIDTQGYVCYDTEELKRWKPKRAGRKPKDFGKYDHLKHDVYFTASNGALVKSKELFICEICGKVTPFCCEGSEPYCCEMCKPLELGKDSQELHRRAITLKESKSANKGK